MPRSTRPPCCDGGATSRPWTRRPSELTSTPCSTRPCERSGRRPARHEHGRPPQPTHRSNSPADPADDFHDHPRRALRRTARGGQRSGARRPASARAAGRGRLRPDPVRCRRSTRVRSGRSQPACGRTEANCSRSRRADRCSRCRERSPALHSQSRRLRRHRRSRCPTHTPPGSSRSSPSSDTGPMHGNAGQTGDLAKGGCTRLRRGGSGSRRGRAGRLAHSAGAGTAYPRPLFIR